MRFVLPFSLMPKYTFAGQTHPQRNNVTLPNYLFMTTADLRIELRITDSVVQVDVDAGAAEHDVLTLRNNVREIAQSLLDACLFPIAGNAAIDIETVALPDGEVKRLFSVFPGLRDGPDGEQMSEDERQIAALLLRMVAPSQELRSALADVRMGLTEGRDTTVHAFRAVDAIRQRFVEAEDKGRDQSWNRMWTAIGGSRELVDRFEHAAVDRRHGGMKEYTHDERELALKAAREIIVRFAKWLEGHAV